MQKLTAFGLTDVGLQRAHNEDSFAIAGQVGFFVVCDGMGGHASGEVASRLCVENAVSFIEQNRNGDANDFPYKSEFEEFECALLSNAVQYANDRVYIEGMKDPKLEGMGTTLVAIRALETECVLAHVGDSRVYRWRPGGKLEQITRDHSLLNFKIDRGELQTAEEISNFKQGNVIVRAIGLKDYVEPEVQVIGRRPGDVYLLCSDGLTDLVDDWSIENVLEANYDELDEACTVLIRMANDRGGKDNITVLLVRVDDDPIEGQADVSALDALHDEVTDPGGSPAQAEDTQPRGVRAVTEGPLQGRRATADTDPRLRTPSRRSNTKKPAAGGPGQKSADSDDDEWYSDNFDVDYRDEEEVDPLGGGGVTFGDLGRADREEVLDETWRMTGGRTDVATDPTLRRVEQPAGGPGALADTPTEKDPNYVDGDEPVSFGKPGQPPGRLAARRSNLAPTGKMPSVAPGARVRGASPGEVQMTETQPTLKRPLGSRPVVKSAKKPASKPEHDGPGELPSIIIDESLLE